MTLILRDQAKHPKPYLLGMLAAVAVASVIHCQIQWPNDLAIHGKKVGGILTEMLPDQSGNPVPVIGIGINLNQSQFPDEISDRATSLHLEHGLEYSASTVAEAIVKQLQKMETPNEWSDIQLVWQEFDQTKGKGYRAPDGELATAIGINADGSLLAMVEGEYRTYLAADALFGTQPEAN